MVLALDYMQKTKTVRPDVEKHALEKIEVGYRRLLGFEVKSEPGGFDWWGKPPANLFLSAYGLMEFRDMAEVYPVDPDLIRRIVAYLRSKQSEDGSWQPPAGQKGWSTDMAKGQAFNLTAYIAWGLARAGEPSEKALRWLAARTRPGAAIPTASRSPRWRSSPPTRTQASAARWSRAWPPRRSRRRGGRPWEPAGSTGVGARGHTATIETTALAIQALLLDGRHRVLAYEALDRLIQWRGKDGRFGTTQSTILALKALLAADAGADAARRPGRPDRRGAKTSETFDLPADLDRAAAGDVHGHGPESLAISVSQPVQGRVRDDRLPHELGAVDAAAARRRAGSRSACATRPSRCRRGAAPRPTSACGTSRTTRRPRW